MPKGSARLYTRWLIGTDYIDPILLLLIHAIKNVLENLEITFSVPPRAINRKYDVLEPFIEFLFHQNRLHLFSDESGWASICPTSHSTCLNFYR
jgi:hypothetical protein